MNRVETGAETSVDRSAGRAVETGPGTGPEADAERTERLGCSDCERIREGGLAQPVNALSSLAYVAAAGALTRSPRTVPGAGRTVFALGLAGVGLGSVAYHGPQPPGAGPMHDWSIAALVGLAVATPMVRRSRHRTGFPGWTARRGAAVAGLAVASAVAYAGGRTSAPTCDPDSPIQLHGAWHVLSAAAFLVLGRCLYGGPEPVGGSGPSDWSPA